MRAVVVLVHVLHGQGFRSFSFAGPDAGVEELLRQDAVVLLHLSVVLGCAGLDVFMLRPD